MKYENSGACAPEFFVSDSLSHKQNRLTKRICLSMMDIRTFLVTMLKKLKKQLEKRLRFVRYCFIMILSLGFVDFFTVQGVPAWVN